MQESSIVEDAIRTLWIPTGVILGFQVAFFKWRLEREVQLTDKAKDAGKPLPPTYLVLSDYLSIAGMFAFVLGVILLPVSGILTARDAQMMFGLGVLLFVGQVLGLAGHYDLYNSRPRYVKQYPKQEVIVVALTIIAGAAYLIWQIVCRP